MFIYIYRYTFNGTVNQDTLPCSRVVSNRVIVCLHGTLSNDKLAIICGQKTRRTSNWFYYNWCIGWKNQPAVVFKPSRGCRMAPLTIHLAPLGGSKNRFLSIQTDDSLEIDHFFIKLVTVESRESQEQWEWLEMIQIHGNLRVPPMPLPQEIRPYEWIWRTMMVKNPAIRPYFLWVAIVGVLLDSVAVENPCWLFLKHETWLEGPSTLPETGSTFSPEVLQRNSHNSWFLSGKCGWKELFGSCCSGTKFF